MEVFWRMLFWHVACFGGFVVFFFSEKVILTCQTESILME